MRILSHMTPQMVCQPPRPKEMKQSVGKEKKTNRAVIAMIKVCVQFFNYCFVTYEAWTCFINILVHFNVAVFVLCFCYCFIMLFYTSTETKL